MPSRKARPPRKSRATAPQTIALTVDPLPGTLPMLTAIDRPLMCRFGWP
jgi:hypothetical protein